MFDEIAPTYDLLNHLLSINADKKWREKAASHLNSQNTQNILDIATGTGDMIIQLSKFTNAKIYGIDISNKMLEIAKDKLKNLNIKNEVILSTMPAEKLVYDDEYFDAITVAFGVRNFENINESIKEIYRVLKKNGYFVVLEFIKPKKSLNRHILNLYIKNILPFVGKMISKNKYAYNYLYESIENFYEEQEFIKICQEQNFYSIKTQKFNLGLVAIFVFRK